MKRIGLLFLTLLFIIPFANAQRNRRKLYNFKEEPVISELLPHEEGASAVVLKDVRVFEYKSEMTGFGSYGYTLYKTIYKNARINDDKAMDKMNKVVIPMNRVKYIVELKARSISPSGVVTRLDSTNIKELKNLQGYGNFKVFAIEGAEVGGEIEYKYTLAMASGSSNVEKFQGEYPIREGRFEIVTPHKFGVIAKGYNGFPELEVDEKGRKAWTATLNNVPGLTEEDYATWDANRMKVAYTIVSQQMFLHSDPVTTWKTIANNIYSTIGKFKSGQLKKASKEMNSLGIDDLSEDDKILKIENHIKSTFTLNRSASSEIKDVLKTKQGNEMGITRLFALFFREADIKFEVVVTSDRYSSRFDKEFPVTSDFDGGLLYFIDQKKYLDPTDFAYRFGIVPFKYTENYSLSMLNEYNYSFRYINASDTNDNKLLKNAMIRFDKNLIMANVSLDYKISGQRAMNARKVFHYSNEQGQQEYIDFLTASGFDDFEITGWKVENENFHASENNQPFKFDGTLKTGSLTEKAGKDVILNIGKIIGKQSELYQENERQQPFDMRHPVVYHYRIGFEIPQGYMVVGLDEFKTDHVMNDGENIIARFKSDYTVSPGKVEITIHEYYVNILYPKETYEDIRKVINAAADFSSKSVLLQKNSQ